jgi:hypothetical protein
MLRFCRCWQLIVCWPLLVGAAAADNWIYGTSSQGGAFAIVQADRSVTISAAGTYIFRAADGDELGQIRLIQVSPAVVGTVIVGVYDWRVGPSAPGAESVWEVDLSGASDGRLSTFRIHGTYGDAEHGGTMRAVRAGTIDIGGDVVVPPNVLRAIDVPTVDASLSIGRDILSCVKVAYVGGPLTVGGSVQAAVSLNFVAGAVTVAGVVAAPFTCSDGAGGDVSFTSTAVHTGEISFGTVPAGRTFSCSGYPSLLRIRSIARDALVSLEQSAGDIEIGESAGDVIDGALSIAADVARLNIAPVTSTGAVYVGGAVESALFSYLDGDLTLGSVSGGMVSPYAISGRAYIGTVAGSFAVFGAYGQVAAGAISPGGSLTLAGPVTGTVTVTDLSGSLVCGNRGPSSTSPPFSGLLTVDALTGNILFNNGLAHNPNLPPGTAELQIGSKSADALFVVNNDGWNRGEDYWDGGVVQIGSTQYAAEDHDQNLWAASCIVGDTKPDGQFNAFDIDPFVLLISDADAYCAQYPGMCEGSTDHFDRGSVLYRGDMNNDGLLNSFDIDPFVLKLTDPDTWYEIYGGTPWLPREVCVPPGELAPFAVEPGPETMEEADGDTGADGAGVPPGFFIDAPPEEVAALLASSVAPERWGALAEMVQTLAAELPDADGAAFWAAVGELLP